MQEEEGGSNGGGAPLFLRTPTIIVPKHKKQNRDEVCPQKPALLLIKALYIFLWCSMILINIDAAFVFLEGGVFVFMQLVVPPLLYLFYHFFCIKQKFSYFCIFFSCGKPDCIWFCSLFICWCIGDKGGERAVFAVCVSSFHFFFKANETGVWGYYPLLASDFFSFFFCSFLFVFFFNFCFFEKESPDGCKAKNHKYWVPSFGELIVLSSVKS